ncbi:hypothetical protein OHA45_20385 [Streptomyces lydicus]|uniref:hypothetical protein n=1 Tax=Streptomyces lydicus TaxID=47763 RepID=UPI002E3766B3|nr:hypothetical protein [Streptomyces lydicus]
MIRIITHARLAALRQDAAQAREQKREVQASADGAYARHVRAVHDLTAEAEAADDKAAEADARAHELRQALDQANIHLAAARASGIEQAARIEALSGDLDAMAEAVVLLHYGKLHSVHPDRPAAERHAASFGVGPGGWSPAADRPAAESAWLISPLREWAVADGGDAG